MIEQLSALLEAQVPCDGESMAQVLELFDRAEAKLHAAVLELDASGAWADEGCLDVTGFVSVHGRCNRGYARRLTGRAAKLAALPVLFAAWQDGVLSKFQVEVVLANVGRHLALFASQEAEVVPTLAPLGPAETVAVMVSWRRHADALDEAADKDEASSELYLSRTMHGRRELSGHLSAGDGEVVAAAIDAARSGGGEGTELVGAPAQRADALVGICRSYLAAHEGEVPGRVSGRVGVLVRYEDLEGFGPGRSADGASMSAEEVQVASCDSVLHRLVYSGRSAVLDFGVGTRTISNNLWAALVARDSYCRHPGCDRPADWCEGHHVVHFSQGGHTKLDNLVLACSRHHHIWHKGWKLTLHDDALLELVSPTGELYQSRPPPLDFLLG